MIIVKVNRVDKNIDDSSALVYIVIWHFTDKIKKCANLRLCQIDSLVFLNSKRLFQLLLFFLTLCQTL